MYYTCTIRVYIKPYEEEFGYRWAGKRFGNTATCNAQGFFVTTGAFSMYAYNATLCIYYACAIGFHMRERYIQTYVEPILHGLPLTIGLYFGIPPLINQMYNPSYIVSWCSIVAYPYPCNQQDSCHVRGDRRIHDIYSARMVFLIMILL